MVANKKFIIIFILTNLSSHIVYSENRDTYTVPHKEELFSYENETFGGFSLLYRKAELNQTDGSDGIVVIYLHGGSGQGEDNQSQLMTNAVSDIYNYLKSNNIKTVILAPQAPYGHQWTGDLMSAVKGLSDEYSGNGDKKVYILGGSMGGYGVWNLLTAYRGYFAGAMPVACNTPRRSPENYLNTRIISVVGRNDFKRDIEAVKYFFEELSELGGEVGVDIEDNWNHRQTCEYSFTPERLDRLFGKK